MGGAGSQVPSPPSLQRLEEELRLHRCSTRECIEQFYLDKLKQVGRAGLGSWHKQRPAARLTALSTEVPGAEPVRPPERPLPLRGG